MTALEGKRAETIRRVAVPSDRSWFDPMLLTRNTEAKFGDVTITGQGLTLILPADPMRIYFAVMSKIDSSAALPIAPHTDPSLYPFATVAIGASYTCKLFDNPLVVGMEWYARYGSDLLIANLRILTIRRS